MNCPSKRSYQENQRSEIPAALFTCGFDYNWKVAGLEPFKWEIPDHCIACHDIMLGNDILFIEVLKNIDQLQADTFLVVFMPLPIKGLDSSPVNVIAIEEISAKGVDSFAADRYSLPLCNTERISMHTSLWKTRS